MPRGPRGKKRPAYASMSETLPRAFTACRLQAQGLYPALCTETYRDLSQPRPYGLHHKCTWFSAESSTGFPQPIHSPVNRLYRHWGGAGRPKQSIVTVGLTAECLAEPLIGRAFARPGGYNDGLHPAGRVKLSNRFNKS